MTVDLDSYMRRIGYDGPREPTLAVLRRLHLLHPTVIPFENFDARFGVTAQLDIESVQTKLVSQRRGGWCFEHNGLFHAVLEALGFDAHPLIARVRWRQPETAPETPKSHRLMSVIIDGETWIADVGFGGLVLTAPLRLVADVEQPTPHEIFRLVRHGAGLEQQARLGDEWAATYRFNLEPAHDVDYEVGNWFCATHPQSLFVGALMVARATPEGRLTLADNDLAVRGLDGVSTRRRLRSGAEMTQVLSDLFGIDAPPYADLDALVDAAPQAKA